MTEIAPRMIKDVAEEAKRKGFNTETSKSGVYVWKSGRKINETHIRARLPSVSAFEIRQVPASPVYLIEIQ